jgi:hypothetical protein
MLYTCGCSYLSVSKAFLQHITPNVKLIAHHGSISGCAADHHLLSDYAATLGLHPSLKDSVAGKDINVKQFKPNFL